ncbi:MAG: DUF1326 domain-containing protein [Acidobacteria bacterium]|nr:DUF1326 domain-containing protein [Acidobacteriota bacterium]
MDTPTIPSWHASGLLFENCSCQLVCPGHMHFSNACSHERCIGYWAVRIDEGSFGEVPLAGLRAVVAFDTPQHMIEGNWTEVIIIDESATPSQRDALEQILDGRAGGAWAVLGRFVTRRLDTRFLPISFTDEGTAHHATIPGLLETSVTNIRGRDRSEPVRFENIFNQIHGSSQVIAIGSTRYDDGVIRIETSKTHGLHSRFEWNVT